jgi:hypothetical protein
MARQVDAPAGDEAVASLQATGDGSRGDGPQVRGDRVETLALLAGFDGCWMTLWLLHDSDRRLWGGAFLAPRISPMGRGTKPLAR